ncbi:MAG TPA: peptidyl-prolyl cis-trans isomerase [Thermoleophilaceae bacterium]|jgi:foldase protein PrsA
MLRTLRLTALLAAIAAVALVATGCGNDVPAGAVAKVGDKEIKKSEFNRWLQAAARQQAQSQPGQAAAPVSVPDPPNFTKCIDAKRKSTPPAQGAAPPNNEQLKAQCKQEFDGLKEQTMQFLISAEWLQQEAKKRGVDASPAEVQKTFQEQKKQAFPKEAEYQKFLKESGRTEQDLLFQVKLSVLTNQLQAKVVEGKGDPKPDEIEDYYNENKKRFSTPESRDLLVVLTKDEADAKKALAELKKGKPWKDVVKKYSEDTASKAQGGKLPGVTKGTQEKAFDDAIFKAPKGQVQGPVKTQFGFYVFQVEKVTPATQQTLQQATDTIKNLLKSQSQQKALSDFVEDFQKRYREETVCAEDYKTSQCDNGPKPPEQQQQQQQSQPQGAPPTKDSGQPAQPVVPGGVPGQPGAPGQVPQGQVPQGGAPPQGAQGAPPQQAPPQQAPPQQAPPGG